MSARVRREITLTVLLSLFVLFSIKYLEWFDYMLNVYFYNMNLHDMLVFDKWGVMMLLIWMAAIVEFGLLIITASYKHRALVRDANKRHARYLDEVVQ